MIVALEEHYFDRSWNKVGSSPRPETPLIKLLANLSAARLQAMDEAGIDMQVISHAPPGAQGLLGDDALTWSRQTNDLLHAAIQEHPKRFAGFASVATSDPNKGADELERAVTRLGFKGAVLHTLPQGPFLDQREYWPLFERASALGVPIYLHPADPNPNTIAAFYRGYAETHPMFIRAGWGFMVEAGTQAMRLILSGIFDVYPGLTIILGHLGETIPFQMERITEALSRDTPMKNFRDVFCKNFYITTSGFFSTPALRCCIDEIGIDRIMFSVDWPYASNTSAANWVQTAHLTEGEREKLLSRNAKRLLKL